MDVRGKKVFVGLSGGVDSAVSAALLKEQGALVTGVFIKGWYPPGMPCTWAADRQDAMRVAARLSIPFETLDASTEYKQSVIDYLLREYKEGRTPNPDVMCNRDIKFGVFYRFAISRGADYIATGHYRSGEKDQSYFLALVPGDILVQTLFPVGEMSKPAVRALAQRFGLPVANKKDSQGVCFLGSISVEEFLQNEIHPEAGPVYDTEGALLGSHRGAALVTLGERLPLPGGPWYVQSKDLRENALTVSKERSPIIKQGVRIEFGLANWLGEPSRAVEAQYRYRGPRLPGRLEGDTFVSEGALPEAPAAGQLIAFYVGQELLGGGIIGAHAD